MYIPNSAGFIKSNILLKYFAERLKKGQTVIKSCLLYSKSTGCIYCFVRKHFSKCHMSLMTGEFSGGMNVLRTLENHENNIKYNRVILCCLTRKTNKICQSIAWGTDEKNVQYYFEVLKILVAVIKYLSGRYLAFRGHEEKWGLPNNENFTEAIELIAEFDPFLHEHLDKCKSDEINVVYLKPCMKNW